MLIVDAGAGHTRTRMVDHTAGSEEEYTTGESTGYTRTEELNHAKFLWLLQCIRQSQLALMRAEANVDAVVCSSHIAVMTNEVNSQCLPNLHNVLSKTQHGCVSITHVSVSQSVQRVATIHGFLID